MSIEEIDKLLEWFGDLVLDDNPQLGAAPETRQCWGGMVPISGRCANLGAMGLMYSENNKDYLDKSQSEASFHH